MNKTLERIEEESHDAANIWTTIELRHLYKKGYIEGAKSERNKTIEDAINKFKLIEAMKAFKENRMPIPEVIKILESLKL